MVKKIKTKKKKKLIKKEYIYYFAYGSNMLQSRLEERVGKVIKVGVGTIQDFKLSFNYGNTVQSFANVKYSDGDNVQGVIYKLTLRQLQILDYYEGYGCPEFYTRIVEIIDDIPVQVYISYNIRREFQKPIMSTYLHFLIQGYKENNIKHEHNLGILKKNIQVIN